MLTTLNKSQFDLSQVAQPLFEQTYLQPFKHSTPPTSNPKHFEILSDRIHRVTHGAMHASRVAAYVKILHLFRVEHGDEAAMRVERVAKTAHLTMTQLIHLLQIAGLFHDAAREDEGEDRWDQQSSEACFQFFKEQIPELSENMAALLANAMSNKDNEEQFKKRALELQFSEDDARDADYLRQLIHDADCLDIMRVRKTFKMRFLDLAKAEGLQTSADAIVQLVDQMRSLIHDQGDQYKDCSIEPHKEGLSIPAPLQANLDINSKEIYEKAGNVYKKVLEDMHRYSELKRVFAPIALPQSLVSQLILFQKDHLKVFYGGPMEGKQGIRWISPVLFETEAGEVHSVYELSFIHCTPENAEGASLFYLDISDVDLKFKNEASKEYRQFADFMQAQGNKKCILVRKANVANVYFPQIFIAKEPLDPLESDRALLRLFLHNCLKATGELVDLVPTSTNLIASNPHEAKEIAMRIKGRIEHFLIESYIFEEDDWKSYYVITHVDREKGQCADETAPIFVRIDSGCVTGQLYGDCSCNCGQELENGLEALIASRNPRSLLVHIPTQDGRGFGSAPKGEEEIYKRGGRGKVHNTEAHTTNRTAAELLYGSREESDIRTYKRCSEILQKRGISSVLLDTANPQKVAALTEANISVSSHRV